MSLRYNFPAERGGANTVYKIIGRLVAPGASVLDIGCDTGNLGVFLKGRGAKTVEGLEMCSEAAAEARRKLDRVTEGSATDDEVISRLGGPFDYVIFADVLEHLPKPEETLRKIAPLVKDGGRVIASLPNVANFRVRLPLLFGRFEYKEIGILDRTHLRFFTKKSAVRLFGDSGYEVISAAPAATFMPGLLLKLFPGMFATRFVIMATLKG